MTRIEKFQHLREQIAQEIMANEHIWKQEKQLEKYEQQLLMIDKSYFQAIIKEISMELNLLNLESFMIQNNYELLNVHDKIILNKMLDEITNFLNEQEQQKPKKPLEDNIFAASEYQVLINDIIVKNDSFAMEWNKKIARVNEYVKSLEAKYRFYNVPQDFETSIKQIKTEKIKFIQAVQTLKNKDKRKEKVSFYYFLAMMVSLILFLTFSLLLLLVK